VGSRVRARRISPGGGVDDADVEVGDEEDDGLA
jgi:hypothetical protein